MRQRDYDNPHNQRFKGADTPEAKYWDEQWRQFDHKKWDPDLADFPQFMNTMRNVSSLLGEDRRFWNLSAKHVFINLNRSFQNDVLARWRKEGEAFDPAQTFMESEDMDWNWLARLLLSSILAAAAGWKRKRKTDPTENDLTRFDQLRTAAEQTDDIVTFALFIERADDLFWEDQVIERVNVKSFIDEMIAILEKPDLGLEEPILEPDWGWISAILRGAISLGNTTVW